MSDNIRDFGRHVFVPLAGALCGCESAEPRGYAASEISAPDKLEIIPSGLHTARKDRRTKHGKRRSRPDSVAVE
jgi:hypothetical protein